jgi:TPR repeat protein
MANVEKEFVDLNKEPDLEALSNALALRETDVEEAEKQLVALARRGSPLSMVHLGYMCAHRSADRGGPDIQLAQHWYQAAIQAGSKVATYNLGSLYLRQKDYANARSVFEQGSAMRYGPSVFNLGRMYLYGLGVDKDYGHALELYKEAAALGNLWGKLAVATMTVTLGDSVLVKLKGLWMVCVASMQFRVEKLLHPKGERLKK